MSENLRELRESVELERQSDLYACACDFAQASRLMSQANAIRRRHFGRGLDPNELREMTNEALSRSSLPGGEG
jgi:hypothetical protein